MNSSRIRSSYLNSGTTEPTSKRWRVIFEYKTDSSWDTKTTKFQCFMDGETRPSRAQAAKFAKKFAANWTGWPEHRLKVWVDDVLEA